MDIHSEGDAIEKNADGTKKVHGGKKSLRRPRRRSGAHLDVKNSPYHADGWPDNVGATSSSFPDKVTGSKRTHTLAGQSRHTLGAAAVGGGSENGAADDSHSDSHDDESDSNGDNDTQSDADEGELLVVSPVQTQAETDRAKRGASLKAHARGPRTKRAGVTSQHRKRPSNSSGHMHDDEAADVSLARKVAKRAALALSPSSPPLHGEDVNPVRSRPGSSPSSLGPDASETKKLSPTSSGGQGSAATTAIEPSATVNGKRADGQAGGLGPFAGALEEGDEEAMTAEETALAARLAEVTQKRNGASGEPDGNPEGGGRREEDEKLTPQEQKLTDALEAPLQVRICLNTEKTCPFKHLLSDIGGCTYATIVALALCASPKDSLTLGEIYNFIEIHRRLIPNATRPNWKNSVRYNLSLRPAFSKQERHDGLRPLHALWHLNREKVPLASRALITLVSQECNMKEYWVINDGRQPPPATVTAAAAGTPASAAVAMSAFGGQPFSEWLQKLPPNKRALFTAYLAGGQGHSQGNYSATATGGASSMPGPLPGGLQAQGANLWSSPMAGQLPAAGLALPPQLASQPPGSFNLLAQMFAQGGQAGLAALSSLAHAGGAVSGPSLSSRTMTGMAPSATAAPFAAATQAPMASVFQMMSGKADGRFGQAGSVATPGAVQPGGQQPTLGAGQLPHSSLAEHLAALQQQLHSQQQQQGQQQPTQLQFPYTKPQFDGGAPMPYAFPQQQQMQPEQQQQQQQSRQQQQQRLQQQGHRQEQHLQQQQLQQQRQQQQQQLNHMLQLQQQSAQTALYNQMMASYQAQVSRLQPPAHQPGGTGALSAVPQSHSSVAQLAAAAPPAAQTGVQPSFPFFMSGPSAGQWGPVVHPLAGGLQAGSVPPMLATAIPSTTTSTMTTS